MRLKQIAGRFDNGDCRLARKAPLSRINRGLLKHSNTTPQEECYVKPMDKSIG